MPVDHNLIAHARQMRADPTNAETHLWWALRSRQLGVKFRRQMPLGPYIADFVCLSHRLIIEVDGAHHGETNAHDRQRDRWLSVQGFQILRFSNGDVLQNRQTVVETIARTLTGCHESHPL